MTQKEIILKYLKEHDCMTMYDGFELGITKTNTRIGELKDYYGAPIESAWCNGVNRYGQKCHYKKYWLTDKEWTYDT